MFNNLLTHIIFYLILLNFARNKCSINAYDVSTLKLLQIVHRHGDRTPISFYPTDPYKSIDHWPEGLGELTVKGKERMYKLGLKLAQRYNGYLGDSPKNIYARSSASNRCIESAAALITGMYPPKNQWIWSNNVRLANDWQPIAIQTVLRSSDGLLVPECECPAADAEYARVMATDDVRQFMSDRREFIEKVENKTGDKFTELRKINYLANTLRAELSYGYGAPKWLDEIGNHSLDKLYEFELYAFRKDWSTKLIQKLRSGLLFRELTNNMNNATIPLLNDSLKRVYSYSTHDTLMVTVLQALGIYNGDPPPFGSALIFELHQLNGSFVVKLFYAKTDANTFELDMNQLRDICGVNQTNCELSQFASIAGQFIPGNWTKECLLLWNSDDNSSEKLSTSKGVGIAAIGFGVGIAAMILFVIIPICVIYRKRLKLSRQQ